jgi:hypothetical protein
MSGLDLPILHWSEQYSQNGVGELVCCCCKALAVVEASWRAVEIEARKTPRWWSAGDITTAYCTRDVSVRGVQRGTEQPTTDAIMLFSTNDWGQHNAKGGEGEGEGVRGGSNWV